jgi:hypothetical protein
VQRSGITTLDAPDRSEPPGSQLPVLASLLVTIVGAILGVGGQWLGFVVLAAGLVALFAGIAWTIRHWDF